MPDTRDPSLEQADDPDPDGGDQAGTWQWLSQEYRLPITAPLSDVQDRTAVVVATDEELQGLVQELREMGWLLRMQEDSAFTVAWAASQTTDPQDTPRRHGMPRPHGRWLAMVEQPPEGHPAPSVLALAEGALDRAAEQPDMPPLRAMIWCVRYAQDHLPRGPLVYRAFFLEQPRNRLLLTIATYQPPAELAEHASAGSTALLPSPLPLLVPPLPTDPLRRGVATAATWLLRPALAMARWGYRLGARLETGPRPSGTERPNLTVLRDTQTPRRHTSN